MQNAGWRGRLRSLTRIRWLLFMGMATAVLGAFLLLSRGLRGGKLDALDGQLLLFLSQYRDPLLNATAVDVTALGSPTVLTMLVLVAALLFTLEGQLRSALQLVCAAVGGAGWSLLMKGSFERARPTLVPRLVEVAGFSYPSGHSLASATVYTTLALLLYAHVRTRRSRWLLLTFAPLLTLTIGLSRPYLGVHYPSDVLAGLLLGTGWALLLMGLFALTPAAPPSAADVLPEQS